MLYTGKQVLARIKGHVKKRGGAFNAWFVDITEDARARLFTTHGVKKKGDHWIYVHAESPSVAQEVKSYLTKTLGTSSGKENQDDKADFVYAYKRNKHTKP